MASSPVSAASDSATSDSEQLQLIAKQLRASGTLGRSARMLGLFDYLVECSIRGTSPKEMDVATHVFGKTLHLDVTQDGMVRVYVHKLRKKLEEYYDGAASGQPVRLTLPRGGYRFTLVPPQDREQKPALQPGCVPVPTVPRHGPGILLVAALGLSVLLNVVVLLHDSWRPRQAVEGIAAVAANPVWSRMLHDDRTIYIVLGDTYVFGETDASKGVQRLVRDLSINSAADLDEYQKVRPELGTRYVDMRVNYLPTSAAYALCDILPLLTPATGRIHVALASDLTANMLATSDVIYVGNLSGMGMLGTMLFAGSRFTVSSRFDELIDHHSGKHYGSHTLAPLPVDQKFHDYGYFATLAGPKGNAIIVIAGTRDVGVMHTAAAATHQSSLRQLHDTDGARSIEALYDVVGLGDADLDGQLLFTSTLDVTKIWTGESSTTRARSPQPTDAPTAPAPVAALVTVAKPTPSL